MDKVDDSSAKGMSEPPQELSVSVKPRRTLTKTLPTDRISFDRQIDALRAYAAVAESNGGKPVGNASAGEVAKLAAATIGMATPFFVDAGFLSRADTGFLVAQEVLTFLATEHGLAPESAPEKLRPALDRHWSSQLLVPRLRAAGALEFDTARKVIGEECSAGQEHIGRIDTLVEFLCFCGLLRKDGTLLRLAGAPKLTPEALATVHDAVPSGSSVPEHDGMETYSLTLDPAAQRRIVVKAPPSVSTAELKRITSWLSFQLIVTGPEAKE